MARKLSVPGVPVHLSQVRKHYTTGRKSFYAFFMPFLAKPPKIGQQACWGILFNQYNFELDHSIYYIYYI
jgi:hypothetical protein